MESARGLISEGSGASAPRRPSHAHAVTWPRRVGLQSPHGRGRYLELLVPTLVPDCTGIPDCVNDSNSWAFAHAHWPLQSACRYDYI